LLEAGFVAISYTYTLVKVKLMVGSTRDHTELLMGEINNPTESWLGNQSTGEGSAKVSLKVGGALGGGVRAPVLTPTRQQEAMTTNKRTL